MMKAMAGKPLRDSFAMKFSEQLTKNLRISERVKPLNTFSQTSQAGSADYWMYVSGITSNIKYSSFPARTGETIELCIIQSV